MHPSWPGNIHSASIVSVVSVGCIQHLLGPFCFNGSACTNLWDYEQIMANLAFYLTISWQHPGRTNSLTGFVAGVSQNSGAPNKKTKWEMDNLSRVTKTKWIFLGLFRDTPWPVECRNPEICGRAHFSGLPATGISQHQAHLLSRENHAQHQHRIWIFL